MFTVVYTGHFAAILNFKTMLFSRIQGIQATSVSQDSWIHMYFHLLKTTLNFAVSEHQHNWTLHRAGLILLSKQVTPHTPSKLSSDFQWNKWEAIQTLFYKKHIYKPQTSIVKNGFLKFSLWCVQSYQSCNINTAAYFNSSQLSTWWESKNQISKPFSFTTSSLPPLCILSANILLPQTSSAARSLQQVA